MLSAGRGHSCGCKLQLCLLLLGRMLVGPEGGILLCVLQVAVPGLLPGCMLPLLPLSPFTGPTAGVLIKLLTPLLVPAII